MTAAVAGTALGNAKYRRMCEVHRQRGLTRVGTFRASYDPWLGLMDWSTSVLVKLMPIIARGTEGISGCLVVSRFD